MGEVKLSGWARDKWKQNPHEPPERAVPEVRGASASPTVAPVCGSPDSSRKLVGQLDPTR
jgi:hypothetical protein